MLREIEGAHHVAGLLRKRLTTHPDEASKDAVLVIVFAMRDAHEAKITIVKQ